MRPEVKVLKTKTGNRSLGIERFARFSSWHSLTKAIARLTNLARALKGNRSDHTHLEAEDLERARKLIIRETQHNAFEEEITALQAGSPLQTGSPLAPLDPYIDQDGLLRVGGRLSASKLEMKEKHPLVMLKSQHVTTLLVRHYHEQVKHQGRHFTEGAIRSAGFWIIGCKRLVSSMIFQCVTCRKLRGRQQVQKMADLPADRLEPGPPFSNVGLDTFGPWTIVTRRTRGGQANSKRWAILFTCLTSRAVHIEVVEELSTSSFINALRRLYSLRGAAKILRSDCGTNFTGCANLLEDYLARNGTKWLFNSPHASHMGGVWERMIGVVRRILDSIMLQVANTPLTHEVLVTFMAEVSAIVNARPLTSVSTDPENPQILTPAMLLTQKTDEAFHLDTDCSKDLYRAQWKRVQALAETFWRRWKVEYLACLQQRRKWTGTTRNLRQGDIVLLKDKEAHRNDWPVGIVEKCTPSTDGLTQSVSVRTWREGKHHTFSRPITELIVLIEA